MRQRDASRDFLFPIRGDRFYDFYAGYLPNGSQALVACWQNGKMVMVVFDAKSNLKGVGHQDLPTPRQLLSTVDPIV